MTTDELLTVNDVALILKVSPFTVKTYIKGGKLKATKPVYDWRIRRSDLDEFIKRGETQ